MNIPKSNHYIPKMLLKGFTDDNGKLYFCRLRFSRRVVKKSAPKNLFVKNHYYNRSDEHGNKDASVEKSLADLEGKVAPVVEKIINTARAGKLPELASSERETLNRFIYRLWIGTPDAPNPVVDNSKEFLQKGIGELGLLTPEGRRKIDILMKDPQKLKRFQHNVRVGGVQNALASRDDEFLQSLRGKKLSIWKICNPKKSFVIGSDPIIMLIPEGSDLSDSMAEVWFPLAYDVAMVYGPFPEGLYEIPDSLIQTINEIISERSSTIAGRSDKLIELLAGVEQRS